MEKKPPEKSFQTKILKMAVESEQVDIERKSKMENLHSILHKISIIPPPRVPKINGQKGKTGNCQF